jgi:hypothetical protein
MNGAVGFYKDAAPTALETGAHAAGWNYFAVSTAGIFQRQRREIFVEKPTAENSSSVGATSAGNMPLLRS